MLTPDAEPLRPAAAVDLRHRCRKHVEASTIVVYVRTTWESAIWRRAGARELSVSVFTGFLH